MGDEETLEEETHTADSIIIATGARLVQVGLSPQNPVDIHFSYIGIPGDINQAKVPGPPIEMNCCDTLVAKNVYG